MKPAIVILAAAMLLCGCNKPDPKITNLESRVSALETEYEYNLKVATNAFDLSVKGVDLGAGNTRDISNIITHLENIYSGYSNIVLRISILESATTTPRRAVIPQTYNPSPTPMPAAVAAQIRADAERDFPGDYTTQNWKIEKETEAWHKLHP